MGLKLFERREDVIDQQVNFVRKLHLRRVDRFTTRVKIFPCCRFFRHQRFLVILSVGELVVF